MHVSNRKKVVRSGPSKRRMGNNGSTPATGGVNRDGGVAGNTTTTTHGGGGGTGEYNYNGNDDASSLGGHSLEGGGSSHHSTYEHGPVTQTVPIPGAQSSHLNNLTTHGGGAGGGHAGTRGGGGGGEALEPALVPVAITCAWHRFLLSFSHSRLEFCTRVSRERVFVRARRRRRVVFSTQTLAMTFLYRLRAPLVVVVFRIHVLFLYLVVRF